MESLSEETIQKQEKIQKTQSQYLLIPMDKIIPNPWNPNKMDEVEYEHLKTNIDTAWGNKNWPIIVRTHPDTPWMYEIIDWAHRYKAMKELGFEEIICILDEGTTPESMVKTLWYNKHRGINDDMLLSELINDLITVYWYTYEQITDALGYSYDELKDIENVNNEGINSFVEDEESDIDDIDEWEEKVSISSNYKIHLSTEQMKQFKLLLKNTWIGDKNIAILACMKHFDDSMPEDYEKKELIERATALWDGSIVMDLDDEETY